MKFHEVRAFTIPGGKEGNSAGVVLNAQTLDPTKRQQIAAELGFSETAFHNVDEAGIDHLEFFTPKKRINNCGHATIATFGVLASSRSEGDYKVIISGHPYTIRIKNKLIGLRQGIKTIQDVSSSYLERVSASLGLSETQVKRIHLVDNGVKFHILELEDFHTLTNLTPNLDAIEKISLEADSIGYYIFVKDQMKMNHLYTRMFGPAYGIPEESATGMGAISLMGLLHKQESLTHLTLTQGKGMNPPGTANLYLEVEAGDIWLFGSYCIESELEIT